MPSRLIEYQTGLTAALAAPPMVAACRRAADQAKTFAERISPVDTGRYRYGRVLLGDHNDPTGSRRNAAGGNFETLPTDTTGGGFHIVAGVRVGGDGRPVAYARLYNDTPYAVFLEWGTRYMRAQRILGRAADAMRI